MGGINRDGRPDSSQILGRVRISHPDQTQILGRVRIGRPESQDGKDKKSWDFSTTLPNVFGQFPRIFETKVRIN